MSIRIYALAKELKIENKKLVDICNQIGITGKGSALASLSEEEVASIKAHLDRGKGGRASVASAERTAAPVRREDYVGPAGTGKKIPVLEGRPRPASVPKPAASAEIPPHYPATPVEPAEVTPEVAPAAELPPPVPPVVPEAPVEVPLPVVAQEIEPVTASPIEVPAATTPAEETLVAPEAPVHVPTPEAPAEFEPVVAQAAELEVTEPPVEEPAVDDGSAAESAPALLAETPPPAPVAPPPKVAIPIPPVRKLPPLSSRVPSLKKPSASRGAAGGKPGAKAGPSIRVAPMPTAHVPKPSKPSEPAPQKPDLKLPLDAIRASKLGGKPLSEHLKKQEEKRKAALEGKKPGAKDRLGVGAVPSAEPARPGKEKGRRGKAVAEGEDEAAAGLVGREQRQLKRKKTAATRQGGPGTEEDEARTPVRTTLRRHRRASSATTAPRKSHVVVELPCTVRSFSEAAGVPAAQVMQKLMELGAPAIITARIEPETAELLAVGLGVEVDFRQPVTLEEKLRAEAEQPDPPEKLQPRPPVVTFLGHVDHGKTSLLDKILTLDVAAHEKGGITQHIRAYRIDRDGRPIAFVDTPGHEAFTAMRARGAMVTDIAVLVVAADDGVMPQTEEAISHAKAAGVPIIVALNKIDLPGVNRDRIFQELATSGLLPSQWGGDTELVPTSAIKGDGIDELLDTILTVAELHEYKANADRPASGICLEAEVQPGRGVVVKVIVQKGTLRPGDVIVSGAAHGRVKAMYDTLNPYKKYKEAGPSTPVNLTGLDVAPAAGDRFFALSDISRAREIAQERATANRQRELGGGVREHVTLENLDRRLREQTEVQNLNIILRADVRGSIEAILKEFGKLQNPEVQIKILQATVGGVTEADVHLADASDAVIIGFNVVPDEKARALSEQLGVQIRRYDIIYQVTEDLRAAMEGKLRPEKREQELGRALVKKTFHISRIGTVAGCQVLTGMIQRDCRVRVIRESRIIGDYGLDSLKREKDDAREVRQGYECGIKLAGYNDLKEGDILEVYKIEEFRRTLETAAARE